MPSEETRPTSEPPGDSATGRRMSLNVISPSGKVEQLRAEAAADRAAARPPHMGANAAHCIRTEATGQKPSGLEEKVIAALRSIFDPEIPVNIYDLGLIYEILIAHDNAVRIRMTLTAPGCPVAGMIVSEVESKVENIPEVRSATVELIWDPPWAREMMSEVARLELGM